MLEAGISSFLLGTLAFLAVATLSRIYPDDRPMRLTLMAVSGLIVAALIGSILLLSFYFWLDSDRKAAPVWIAITGGLVLALASVVLRGKARATKS